LTILITGGLGFLGRHLTKALLEAGQRVVLLDLVEERPSWVPEGVEVVVGDISCWPDLLHPLRRFQVETVFHLAALTSAASEANPMAAFRINIEGTANLLEAAHILGVRRVLFPSSLAVYGPGLPEPVAEDVNLTPGSAYGVCKVFGELWGLWYSRARGIDFRALRFPSILGPGRSLRAASAYSALIIEKAARGEPYTIPVPEDTRLPILHYKDAVRALLLLYKARDPASRIYNIAGLSPTALEIVREVERQLGQVNLTFRPDPQITRIIKSWPSRLDDTRARAELGWRPRYDLQALVADLIAEVRTRLEGQPIAT
jgi:threonine 3-dehydrogenase